MASLANMASVAFLAADDDVKGDAEKSAEKSAAPIAAKLARGIKT